MYLSLRTQDINIEELKTGKNVFSIYLEKMDIVRMHKLLMRGADINYINRKNGYTHLRNAIEKELPSKIVRWLIRSGANPHILGYDGQDCCQVA